jgi:Flp pilus assembly protein TadD
MSRPLRFGSAASAIVLAAMLASCATTQPKTGFGGKADENVGLATRAVAALNANNVPAAIDFAERAVEKNPGDAGFRAILGNAYFAAGRFLSAEAAYKDSLTIYSNQPQVVLKLALVETGLGKKDEAVAFLEAGRSVLDPSNYGLALALAGRPDEAIRILDAAARQPGADATVRQNLALAHALAGDWTEARTIAAQDVPANQLDTRIQQWMQFASPKKPSDQIASLVGVTPAAVDHGEPVRLALAKSETMLASAAPAARRVAVPSVQPAPSVGAPHGIEPGPGAQPQVADAVTPPAPVVPKFVEAVAPQEQPHVTPAVATTPAGPKSSPKPAIAESQLSAPVAMISAAAHEISSEARALVETFIPKKAPPVAHSSKARHMMAARRTVHPGEAVVQLGAYRSPEYVTAAWDKLSRRFPALRAYLPLRARFDSANGTYWRLSIQGFDNQREAIARCKLLKARGGNCFVRPVAGDAPVEMASN